jgi:hypothetical protein
MQSRSRGAIGARVMSNSDGKKPVARMERSAIRGRQSSFYVAPGFRFVSSGLRRRTKKEAERRQTHCRQSRTSGCGRATDKSACADPSAVGRARLPAFHHGSCQGEYLIPKARPGPGFVVTASTGRASRRRCRTHLQRCTPHAGHSAGRHDARTARERIATPPAGTDLAPTPGYACRTRPYWARFDSLVL